MHTHCLQDRPIFCRLIRTHTAATVVSLQLIALFSQSVYGGDSYGEALKEIRETAAAICEKTPLEHTDQGIELSGDAKAKVNGLIGKVADIGIEGTGKYTSGTEKRALLEKDVATAIQTGDDCRLLVFKILERDLIRGRPNDSRAPTVQQRRTSTSTKQRSESEKPASTPEDDDTFFLGDKPTRRWALRYEQFVQNANFMAEDWSDPKGWSDPEEHDEFTYGQNQTCSNDIGRLKNEGVENVFGFVRLNTVQHIVERCVLLYGYPTRAAAIRDIQHVENLRSEFSVAANSSAALDGSVPGPIDVLNLESLCETRHFKKVTILFEYSCESDFGLR